ncbi:MAG: SpoIID/LytB domain-containing protein [Microcystaceae cyanobacterium]
MAGKTVSDSVASVFQFLLLKRHHRWLFLVLWMIFATPVQAATELRVAIKKDVSQVKVGSSTTALVKDGAGRKLGEIVGMMAFSAQPSNSGVSLAQWRASQLSIEPTEGGFVWIGDRWYRGRIRLVRQGKGVTAVDQLDLEQYLYSVVGAEAFPTWPQEALKAQAVAARTYALYQSTTSGNKLYDVDTTTQTQVYKGLESEYLSTHDAVNATEGKVLTYNGKAILAAFHSSSGGHTENVEDVWNSRLPYLRGVIDYDQESPVFQWTKTFSASQLGSLVAGVGTVKSMIPERTTPLGRILTMKVVGDRGTKDIKGTQLRQALELKSTLFTVADENGTFQIYGRGYGHGIGLSQWGTYYLALQGVDYQQILAHYYQNARLTNR